MLNVVIGPPASGKSTYVKQHARPGDIIIDYDALANTLAGVEPANHQHPQHIKNVTKAARQAAIDTAIKQDATTWLIHSNPAQSTLDRYKEQGATIHTIDPGKDVVMHRCKHERPPSMLKIAAAWYAKRDKRPSPNERGYNHTHRLKRKQLLARLNDGEPCWWCNRPMYENPKQNWDHKPLAADHEQAHGAKNRELANRLLHFTCNSQRQDGSHDHHRPALNVLHKTSQTPHKTTTNNPFGW